MSTDPSWPDGGEFHTRADYVRFIGQFVEAFEWIRFEETQAPQVVGQYAIFRGAWVGEGNASGLETRSPEFSVVLSSDGELITEARFFFDPEAAREQAESRT